MNFANRYKLNDAERKWFEARNSISTQTAPCGLPISVCKTCVGGCASELGYDLGVDKDDLIRYQQKLLFNLARQYKKLHYYIDENYMDLNKDDIENLLDVEKNIKLAEIVTNDSEE